MCNIIEGRIKTQLGNYRRNGGKKNTSWANRFFILLLCVCICVCLCVWLVVVVVVCN